MASISSVLVKNKDASPSILILTADQLSKYFTEKIEAVRLETSHAETPIYHRCDDIHSFNTFSEFSMADMLRIILNYPKKPCALDPSPTEVLMDVLDSILPFIWAMCNASIKEGYLPEIMKQAIVIPILKKPGQDTE